MRGDEEGGGPTTLRWFVAIQPGGSIQKVAETCSKESGGKYEIELELLPTDATASSASSWSAASAPRTPRST